MTTAIDTRTIKIELDINAPVADVWKALTDPDELARWFPLKAEVEPGVGGSIRLYWDSQIDGRNAIRVWEPERHLQMGWFEPAEQEADTPDTVFYSDQEARRRLAVDFFLEGEGGRTVLRMVHSGFSRDESWDDEFDGHRRGWTFELESLRNYLEHHRSETRDVAWVRHPVEMSKEEAWSRLVSKDALLRDGALDGLTPGDRYAITTTHGDRFEGVVVVAQAPSEFAGTVENLDNGLMRFGVEAHTGRLEAYFWLSTWTGPDRAGEFRTRWSKTFSELFV